MTYQGFIDQDFVEHRARMATACRAALDEIDDMLRTYEQKGVLKLWEMLDTQRLRQLRREINKTLGELQGIIEIETTGAVSSAYGIALDYGAFVIENTVGEGGYAFAGLNETLLRASLDRKIGGLTISDRLTQERLDLLWHERDAVAKAQLMGYGAQKTARDVILADVKQGVERSYSRALLIARTETARNTTQATIDASSDAERQGIKTRLKWHSSPTGHPHDPPHSTYNGKLSKLNPETGEHEFIIGGKPSRGPGMCEAVEHNFNCRCRVTTYCVGYDEFYPTAEDFAKWRA